MNRMIPSRLMLSFLVLMLAGISSSCQKKEPAADASNEFETKPTSVAVESTELGEASGIAASRINHGFLWVLEDSGNPPALFLLGTDGKILKTVHIRSAL